MLKNTAALLLIGNELLNGEIEDRNILFLTQSLTQRGIKLREVRIVADEEQDIIEATQQLSQRYNFVFTTGGIGPTHDDITAKSIAKALNLPLIRHPKALEKIQQIIPHDQLNEARLSMADMPEGAELIDNSISGVPGFKVQNIFVLAGVPAIMKDMFLSLDSVLPKFKPLFVEKVISHTLREGDIAKYLYDLQNQFPKVSMGSYPHFNKNNRFIEVVLRGEEREVVKQVKDLVLQMFARLERRT